MPFGGAGALHAGALIKEVGLAAALVPLYPGVTSALGCVIADMRHDFVRTINRVLGAPEAGGLDPSALNVAVADAVQSGRTLLERSGVKLEGIDTQVELDMSYVGQTHTVAVPLTSAVDRLNSEAIRTAFEAAYRQAFGRVLENIPGPAPGPGGRPPGAGGGGGPRPGGGGGGGPRQGQNRGGGGFGPGGVLPRRGSKTASTCRWTPSSRDRRSWSSPTPRPGST